ncbi:MAG: NAD(P)H-dependent oxidoreductase [Pseudomonadota bacterium]|jgi:NAD(P)H dehydrogenase (quinone)|nr:NAD(P)H-dependent oxidoreductase [Rubrivivax sp.]MCA3257958.1 NAD(P)H-dependent oxidoreductase [Rubrivivax sp.]MCE2911424.1 NAD(P)H-dependent oxidoreductase [Rubrivivax sp.]MCZ8032338.1 NAD(P)H-dependent oxidoreductase [Rubrivivax sp.]
MKHLVVLAHPREASFTRRVASTYIDAVQGLGHAVVLRDLYAMRFQPVADDDEGRTRPQRAPAADVQVEMDHLVAADVVTFVSPVWWIAPPAIMKGWLDRVLRGGGFAYGYGPQGPRGAMAGKKSLVFTSSGSTEGEFVDSRKLDAIRVMWGAGTVEFCGITLLEHLHFGPVGSRSTPGMIEAYLERTRQAVQRHFAGGPPAG